MLSRDAESLFWMSRYMERAENVARFIEVNLQALLDLPIGFREQWEPLVITSGDHELFEKNYGPSSQGSATKTNVLGFLTFDTENPNSIVGCIDKARENARQVRGLLTAEMWEQLNTFWLQMRDAYAPARADSDPTGFYRDVRNAVQLFTGLSESALARDEGWHFLQIGRYMERADKTSRILDVKYFILLPKPSDVGSVVDDLLWAVLLQSVSGYEMFRRAYGRISPESVVSFLLLSREFPRSVRFCLEEAERSLLAVTGTPQGTYRLEPEKRLSRLRAEVAYADVVEIMAAGLHEYLDNLQTRLNRVGASIQSTFFTLAAAESMGVSALQ